MWPISRAAKCWTTVTHCWCTSSCWRLQWRLSCSASSWASFSARPTWRQRAAVCSTSPSTCPTCFASLGRIASRPKWRWPPYVDQRTCFERCRVMQMVLIVPPEPAVSGGVWFWDRVLVALRGARRGPAVGQHSEQPAGERHLLISHLHPYDGTGCHAVCHPCLVPGQRFSRWGLWTEVRLK